MPEPPAWLGDQTLRTADDPEQPSDRDITAGHEAGHAIVAWYLNTWPQIALDVTLGGGRTDRISACTAEEDIAITFAGIEADRLRGLWSAELVAAQNQDIINVRKRHPGVTKAGTDPARQRARGILLENRNAWKRVKDRLSESDSIDWREMTFFISGKDVHLICTICRREVDVDDPRAMIRNRQGQTLCRDCSLDMPLTEILHPESPDHFY